MLIKGFPILKERDSSLGPETSIELMIRRILEEKLKMEQRAIMKYIRIIRLQQGDKLHNLGSTFNLIVKGKILNHET
jgi:hypothetical protein